MIVVGCSIGMLDGTVDGTVEGGGLIINEFLITDLDDSC